MGGGGDDDDDDDEVEEKSIVAVTRNVAGDTVFGHGLAVGMVGPSECTRVRGADVVKFKTPISVYYAGARRNHIYYVLAQSVGGACAPPVRTVWLVRDGREGQANAERHGVVSGHWRR